MLHNQEKWQRAGMDAENAMALANGDNMPHTGQAYADSAPWLLPAHSGTADGTPPSGIENNPEIFNIIFESLGHLAYAAGSVVAATGMTAFMAGLFSRARRTTREPDWNGRLSRDEQQRFARLAQTLIVPFRAFRGQPHTLGKIGRASCRERV